MIIYTLRSYLELMAMRFSLRSSRQPPSPCARACARQVDRRHRRRLYNGLKYKVREIK